MKGQWLLAFALPFCWSAQALTLRPPSFAELVGTAEQIVTGVITRTECEICEVADGRKVPFTFVTIEVAETLKGPRMASVVLRCLGGTAGGETVQVVGAPQFRVGDSGFFFIHNNGTQFVPLVGINHGCYWNVYDETTGAEIVVRDDGQPLTSIAQVQIPLRHDGRGVSTAAESPSRNALSPVQFAEQIKSELARAPR